MVQAITHDAVMGWIRKRCATESDAQASLRALRRQAEPSRTLPTLGAFDSGLNASEQAARAEIEKIRDQASADIPVMEQCMRELGWTPDVQFDQGIRMTIKWYLGNKGWWEKLLGRKQVP